MGSLQTHADVLLSDTCAKVVKQRMAAGAPSVGSSAKLFVVEACKRFIRGSGCKHTAVTQNQLPRTDGTSGSVMGEAFPATEGTAGWPNLVEDALRRPTKSNRGGVLVTKAVREENGPGDIFVVAAKPGWGHRSYS